MCMCMCTYIYIYIYIYLYIHIQTKHITIETKTHMRRSTQIGSDAACVPRDLSQGQRDDRNAFTLWFRTQTMRT